MTTRIATAIVVPEQSLAEYGVRHEQMNRAMRESIAAHGGRNLSIFAAPDLGVVFMYVEVDDVEIWNSSAQSSATLEWWKDMSDIMPTNDDLSPIATDLPLVFHLDIDAREANAEA